MQTAVTLSGLSATLRALVPVLLPVALLVAGLVVAPGSGVPTEPAAANPTGPGDEIVDEDAPTNHTANVTLYDAGYHSFEDATDVEAAIAGGRVTEPGTMAVNETLLVVIESDRLAAAMDERDGSTTERFAAALDGPADLYLVQTNPGTMVTRTFALVEAENATAFRNGTTVYALLDTGRLSFRKERTNGTHPVDTLYEDRFAVDFGFDLYEPPWEPPGDSPWGPTFTLSEERYLDETPEPTPTDSPTSTRTPTESPTPTRTSTESPTTTASTDAPGEPTTTSGRSRTETVRESPSSNESGTQTGTPTTPHEDSPGFTAGGVLVALVVLTLVGRSRR